MEHINNFKNKIEKKYLLEDINLYIRFIKANSELTENCDINNYTLLELFDLGLIKDISEVREVETLLKADVFTNFIKAINTKLSKEIKDEYIDRFYNNSKVIKQNDFKYTLVDLFCGAGGLSLGFTYENVEILLANDINKSSLRTYQFNHPEVDNCRIVNKDISLIADNINEYLTKEEINNLDFLIGGPPCQGFSSANKQRIIDDPRNELYKYFLKSVSKLKPKFVVMENVKGMLSVADQVIQDFATIQENGKIVYDVGYTVLNSKNFGVPQSRERLIYIAIRNDIKDSVKVKVDDIIESLHNNISEDEFTLRHALYGLPKLEAEKEKFKNEVDSDKSGYKIILNKSDSNEYIDRINHGKNTKYLFNHKARYLNQNNFEIYSRMKQGEDSTASSIQDIYKYSHRSHIFKDKYYKLLLDKPSRTITAHLKMDGHSHIHPTQIRSLSPREAARIQSFPDDFLFKGSYLDTFLQIGNSVPPLMAKGIANRLVNILEEYYA